MKRRLYKWDKKTQKMVLIYQSGYDNKSAWVRDDTPDETIISPLTEEKFDSMSKYKAHLDAHGYEITGGDHFTGRGLMDYKYKAPIDEIRNEAAEAVRRREWGMSPITDKQREQYAREAEAVAARGSMNEYHKHQAEKFRHDFEKKYEK